ncbi:hypothetical protein EDB89DRAFT_2246016 [Lactarius sanguifluus]|nr:hypothetical protein EDB89DRAFT_2246016 [Lactarius sanguifluus]
MPIVPHATPGPIEVASDETLHFDFPGSDIVLCSYDSHDFRVLKLYIVICSPVLQELIQSVSNTDISNGEKQEPLPVVELPESKETLYSLLTFIFPVAPVLPSTPEKIMELLAVAQKYQMDSVMTHIRGAIARQDPPFLRPETALHVYFLAQQHELRQEAVQAARVTLRLSMTIEDLGDKLEFPGMTGAYLHELWKYHQQVRTDLRSGVLEFRNSELPHDVQALRCSGPRSNMYPFPPWLDSYIRAIAESPRLFDPVEFEDARARHIGSEISNTRYSHVCSCVEISSHSQVIRAFWGALATVVHGTIEKADPTLGLVKEEPMSENLDPPSVPLCLDTPDANIIVQSSDKVDFHVHKSLLAMSSPFFKDLLSLPQPPDDELVDGLPVIQLPENADLLNSLISLLYPIPPSSPALMKRCSPYSLPARNTTWNQFNPIFVRGSNLGRFLRQLRPKRSVHVPSQAAWGLLQNWRMRQVSP